MQPANVIQGAVSCPAFCHTETISFLHSFVHLRLPNTSQLLGPLAPLPFPKYARSLLPPQRLQVLEYDHIRIKQPIDTIRHTGLLFTRQFPRRGRASDAFLETHFC